MTDIVSLLRDDEFAGSKLDHMAADEIERLRSEVEALRQWKSEGIVSQCVCCEGPSPQDGCECVLCEKARVDRLRAEIRELNRFPTV